MKSEIHPEYLETTVTCGCGEVFTTRSTKASGSIYVEVCSVCHPFYTGKKKYIDTTGRVERFRQLAERAKEKQSATGTGKKPRVKKTTAEESAKQAA